MIDRAIFQALLHQVFIPARTARAGIVTGQVQKLSQMICEFNACFTACNHRDNIILLQLIEDLIPCVLQTDKEIIPSVAIQQLRRDIFSTLNVRAPVSFFIEFRCHIISG